ncbi:hypothetical protein HYN56_09860 [Flavobacterium crocinum]|uniref:GLPGLI family protein n=1 Tax=Flavobacterium crocinum TaxID=2183896 RepID=A0A2S1YKA9_9FLAO|nr:GLPGLI family protein [Flavobacterium crocinum]AWK04519.1 hypothetical protein HYN56_09860 [Flavobacterium crocinum]
MIKFRLLLGILFSVITINAQSFQGKVVYKSIALDKERYLNQLADFSISPSKKAELQESISILERMFENSYELIFNKSLSKFKKKAKIGSDGKEDISAMSSTIYKDFDKHIYYEDKEIVGDNFLICDSLPKYDWKVSTEVKKIGKYTCSKANFTNSIIRYKRIPSPNGGFETKPETEVISGEAWYAAEIPVSNGPDRFHGLPGLILEVTYNQGKSKMICTEIEINNDQKQKIELPTDKKAISEEQYWKEKDM